ncbi:hypothetical protein FHS18_004145 [Paenibacillus phyllosphaerae]|uniref:Uncharacterized protein n=1 Tax=Paenibacillus phyllosphaerae TaxID=274593 RepID=A0A7W5B0L2_9BACL|nr:hypothetical protein [Paenibacillus phyllosphaerae]MBB3112067.1 hypothetical protein [Paenibacillus phyllosphaerae]
MTSHTTVSLSYSEMIQRWLESTKRNQSKENRSRLAAGLGYAERLFIERVWLPAFNKLDNLHPEYEIKDFKDGQGSLILPISREI